MTRTLLLAAGIWLGFILALLIVRGWWLSWIGEDDR